MAQMPKHPRIKTVWLKLRHPRLENWQRENLLIGLPRDFKLPYPCPRNEHEEGMNWVSVNSVASGRADW